MKNCFVTLILLTVILSFSCNGQKGGTVKNEQMTCDIDTMVYPTDLIDVERERVEVNVSEDERLRFYCWNTLMGGTCPDYEVIAQYRTDSNEVKTRTFREPNMLSPAWVSGIYTIKKDDGSTYYIAVRRHRASSKDGYAWVDAYAIDGDSLIDVSVTDGGANVDDGAVPNVNYSISDWSYTTNGEGYDWMYEYDKGNGNFYVPISEGDSLTPEMTDRYLLYHFDGKRFVKKGEVGHRGLHPSLQRYKRLLSLFKTKGYIIRVDQLEDGSLRYASWKSHANLSEEPELVIMGGRVLKERNEECVENSYLFTNEGVEYVVGYGETHHESDDYDTYHEYLVVRRNGKIILKQERI